MAKRLNKEPKELWNIAKLARESGMTEAAIRGRISSGTWVESVHYFRQGRRLMMDPEECKKFWTEEQ